MVPPQDLPRVIRQYPAYIPDEHSTCRTLTQSQHANEETTTPRATHQEQHRSLAQAHATRRCPERQQCARGAYCCRCRPSTRAGMCCRRTSRRKTSIYSPTTVPICTPPPLPAAVEPPRIHGGSGSLCPVAHGKLPCSRTRQRLRARTQRAPPTRNQQRERYSASRGPQLA
eukprot:1940895-Rhodomonas_salina.1